MQCSPELMHLKKLHKVFSYYTLKVDLGSFDKKPYRSQAERFLISGYHFSEKKQFEISKKVVSISRVFTVYHDPGLSDLLNNILDNSA